MQLVRENQDIRHYFMFGELNRGKMSSEKLLRENGFELTYVPDSDHNVFVKNPEFIFEFVEKTLKGNENVK